VGLTVVGHASHGFQLTPIAQILPSGNFPGGPPDADHNPDVLMSRNDFGKADDLGCPVVVLFLEPGNGTQDLPIQR
jgi:hypothetical protein